EIGRPIATYCEEDFRNVVEVRRRNQRDGGGFIWREEVAASTEQQLDTVADGLIPRDTLVFEVARPAVTPKLPWQVKRARSKTSRSMTVRAIDAISESRQKSATF